MTRLSWKRQISLGFGLFLDLVLARPHPRSLSLGPQALLISRRSSNRRHRSTTSPVSCLLTQFTMRLYTRIASRRRSAVPSFSPAT